MASLRVKITASNGRTFQQPTGLFINNEWVNSSNGQTITSINPTSESEIASVQAATATDVDVAVRAARAAFEGQPWRGLGATDRGYLLLKLADMVELERETLATIETLDNGKTYRDALVDIEEAFTILRYYGGWADKNFGQVIETTRSKLTYTVREPIGVCGQIIPWNYPLAMAAWKLGPALACGNTLVLKAAEQTPLSVLYLANIIAQAGFPPGVVNIINGHGAEAGAALAQHPNVDKIAFTGSTTTGQAIMKMASETMKNITLETGGKSPLIIFEDADLKSAAEWTHNGIMGNMGQNCTATSRVFIHENIYDEFLQIVLEYVAKHSQIGDPFDDSTLHGPQVSKAQYDRVLSYIKIAKDEGARIILGGKPAANRPNGKGFFIEPTVVSDVTPNMRIYREEIFGPVLAVIKFSSEEQVLGMANDTIYGLGGAVFTRDITRAHRVAQKIEAGTIWINSSNDNDVRVPFGGYKQSGIGRECGQAGLEAYSNVKAIHLNLAS